MKRKSMAPPTTELINTSFPPAKVIAHRIRHTLSIRLHDEMHLTKLSGTTALFLMTVFSLCLLGDRLTIRNLRLFKSHRYLLIVLQAPFQRAQVELTLSMHDGLPEFFALLHHPCRVFQNALRYPYHRACCRSSHLSASRYSRCHRR